MTPRLSWLPIIALALTLAGCHSPCGRESPPRILGDVPALAVPETAFAPVIDGDLADAAWSNAAVIPALQPPLGAAPTNLLPTTARVLWDARFLYVAFDCTDPDVYCTGTLKHDDLLYKEDVCEVFVDGFGDGRQFIEIQVNPQGTNLDLLYIFTREAEYTPEMRLTQRLCETDRWKLLEWEMAGLHTAARRTARGWTAELAMPAETIMKRRGSPVFRPGEIRAHFIRYDWPLENGARASMPAQQNWSPVVVGNPHNSPARMGRLLLQPASQGKSR